MSYWPFVRLAKRAEANYPIRKTAIVDLNILDDFLEDNPEVVSELKKRRGMRYGEITEARFGFGKACQRRT